MVKGVTRKVVVMRPEASDIFEQAIFIIKSGGSGSGHSPDDILREARRIASGCAHTSGERMPGLVKKMLCAAAGGAGVGIAWLLTAIF